MKAVRYHSYGGAEVLVYEEVDRPVAGAGQVVVQVAGTAFNLLDAAIRGGLVREVFPVELPHVPGYDAAGVIAEVGEGVDGWSVGDAVVVFLPPLAPGAAAEYVTAQVEALAAAPRTVELADAATLPSVGLTAWQMLFEHAELRSGQSVLVDGAGGAVGGYAVQLAAQAGARVTAVAGRRSIERVRSYGADRVVDYTAGPVADALAGERFDVVLHLAPTSADLTPTSPEEIARLVELVVDGGVFLSTTTPGPSDAGRGVRAERIFVRSDPDQLAELVARVDRGDLRIHVAERVPLAELASVHARAAAGELLGKTVLIP